jgi:hypothetical protein
MLRFSLNRLYVLFPVFKSGTCLVLQPLNGILLFHLLRIMVHFKSGFFQQFQWQPYPLHPFPDAEE